jgi:hypothetical protein
MMLRIVLFSMLVARAMTSEHNGDGVNEKTRGVDKGHGRRYLRGRRIAWQASLWRFVEPDNVAKSSPPVINDDSVTLSSSRAGPHLVQPSSSSGNRTIGNKPLRNKNGGGDADPDFGNETKAPSNSWKTPTLFAWDSSQGSQTVDTSTDDVAFSSAHKSWDFQPKNGTINEHGSDSSNDHDEVSLIISPTSSVRNQTGPSSGDKGTQEDTLSPFQAPQSIHATRNRTSTINVQHAGQTETVP